MTTGKEALLEQLRADGVRYVFGNPGTTEQPFMDALQDYPELEFILSLHEGVAVGMADAYARMTQRPAFVEVHAAPGLGNGMGMIYNAKATRAPLVVYAGQVDSRTLLREPVLFEDAVSMAQPACKWAAEARTADEVPVLVRRAMKVAATPPSGPVFLSLPLDVLDEQTDVPIRRTVELHSRWRPDQAAVREAAALLSGASRPAIIVSDGVAMSGAQAEVVALAELVGAPLYGGSFVLQLNVPYEHPHWAGQLDVMNAAGPGGHLDGVDVILLVGTAEPSTFTAPPAEHLPSSARIIEIHADPWELGKSDPADVAIAADPRETLLELITLIRELQTVEQLDAARTRAADVAAARKRAHDQQLRSDEQHRDQVPIAPTRLLEELASALPQDAAIFEEAISSGFPLEWYLRPKPGRFLRGRAGAIGAGMGGTLGLQLALPDAPVVGIEGDGSAMFGITALWTAAHHHLPVTWVICNNRSYRVLKLNMQKYLGEAGARRQFVEMDLEDPPIDFVGLAESLGVSGYRVERPQDLGDVLRDAIAHPGPALVDVLVDGSVSTLG